MLQYAKVMQALTDIKGELFLDIAAEIDTAQASWQRIVADPTFLHKAKQISSPWLIPSWTGQVDAIYDIDSLKNPYHVISVDGSQVYPDRHQGTSCYMVNIVTVEITYGLEQNNVAFNSHPYVFAGRSHEEAEESPTDIVNNKRQELELRTGLHLCRSAQQEIPTVFLFDGSLIFWHLASKSSPLKDAYMATNLALLHQFYEQSFLLGGYISLPKSKELVNLIRIELCKFIIDGCVAHRSVDHVVDTTVAGFFLGPYTRSLVFKSNSPICQLYPDHLAPYFFYLHVGHEIGRVEIPAWIAKDDAKVSLVAQVMRDQARKGNGYPVALAEAHEQAVVKGPDRDFFYQMINKLAIEHKQCIALSQ